MYQNKLPPFKSVFPKEFSECHSTDLSCFLRPETRSSLHAHSWLPVVSTRIASPSSSALAAEGTDGKALRNRKRKKRVLLSPAAPGTSSQGPCWMSDSKSIREHSGAFQEGQTPSRPEVESCALGLLANSRSPMLKGQMAWVSHGLCLAEWGPQHQHRFSCQ